MSSFDKEIDSMKIPLKDIKDATYNFSDVYLFRQGGSKNTYKGRVFRFGKWIDIIARRFDPDCWRGLVEFKWEITMLCSLKHPNLATIVGFCDESDEKIIVYKFEDKRSLDQYLNDPTSLPWTLRLQICLGIARALRYIHYDEGRDFSVIHRNIKSSKILLDDWWEPKLNGFELSIIQPAYRRQRIVLDRLISGTYAYADPAYLKDEGVTHKSDLYSLGVVFFQVLSGRKAFLGLSGSRKPISTEQVPQYSASTMVPSSSSLIKLLKSSEKPISMEQVPLRSDKPRSIEQVPLRSGSIKPPSMEKVPPLRDSLELRKPSQAPTRKLAFPQPISTEQVSPWSASSSSWLPPSFDSLELLKPSMKQVSLVSASWSSSSSSSPRLPGLRDSLELTIPSQTPKPKVALPQPSRPWLPRQSQIPSWQLKTTPSFKDLRNLLLSWKSLSAAEKQTRSFGSNTVDYYLDDQYMTTMKSLPILHPKDEWLLAKVAKSLYENGTLDDIIHPGLRWQMDFQSLKVFSYAAYCCLNDQRAQRPNIDRVISAIEEALELQLAYEKSLVIEEDSTVAAEVSSSKLLKGTNLEKLMIEFDAIEKATENFNDKYHLATGGYGSVYKAKLEHFDFTAMKDNKESELPKKSSTVAIKCILSRADKQGEQGFFAEIETLSCCRHPNVVSLLGFCHKPPHMILVYEHVPKGSLDDHLGNNKNMTNLTWMQRLRICIDVAYGLDYIHTAVDKKPKMIHRDIKSGNILLDDNWKAKIADFGLSKLNPHECTVSTLQTTNIAGTIVYLDPEYHKTGKLKKESDVYSFGVVLFEIMTGRLAHDPVYTSLHVRGLGPVVRQNFKKNETLEEMIDPNLKEESEEKAFMDSKGPNKESLRTFIKIGIQCLEETQAKRPTMKDVINELEKALRLQENSEDSVRLSFAALKSGTRNFSLKRGHGNVYVGEIVRAKGLTPVAVKRWASTRDQEFLADLEILFEYKHKNIINLIGYCDEGNEKITVYEYASNGSLDMHLESLTWTQRLNIGIDVALGLEFLHEGGEAAVIHRDIKSSNVLLDGDWKANIGGFGLSITDLLVDETHGTLGYVDPQYATQKFLTKESDIYSFGVVLLEMMCGRIQDPNKNLVDLVKCHYKEGNVDELVFEGIKDQIIPKSLIALVKIACECLHDEKEKRPKTRTLVLQLQEALELQEDIEIWEAKLPRDYKEITDILKPLEKYTNVRNKDLYDMFSKGIHLPEGNVCLSISGNREINEMVSSTTFSYENHGLRKWRSIKKSRFQRVVKMMDISNLRIHIKIKTQFLTPNVIYGAHLVFKFCDPRKFSTQPMYVNLRYKMRSENLHAYFATRGEGEWMMIELCRFLPHKRDVDFEVLLESLSRYYCGSGAIYVDGVYFRAIDDATLKVSHEAYEKLKGVERVLKSNSDSERVPLDYEEITQLEDGEKIFSQSKADEKTYQRLPAKMVLPEHSDVKCFNWKSLVDAEPRFQEVAELLSRQVFRIKCTIKTHNLSPDTDYACYLIFKLSEKCHGLHCPVRVRNVLLRKNKENKFLYFRTPRLVNFHVNDSVPKLREDGLMEVNVWEFNLANKLGDDHLPVNLKLRCYEGTMSGLIVYGIECRSI